MAKKKTRLRVIPLGGLEEVGKNMTVIEYGQDLILVDTGLMFPDDELPGVDLVLPDFSYVLERADRLRGIVITHGHEDHTGALPYLLKDIGRNIPVYGTKLTLGLVGARLEEHKSARAKLREMRPGRTITLGCFSFTPFAVNHSIPDGVGLIIQTPVGVIVHTGDFKLDQTPIDGRSTDFAALAAAGSKGVLLLMSDSTNAENPGVTRPEAMVGGTLLRLFQQAQGRIIVASFASHIHRLQQVCDAARACGRIVVVTGRSMINNTRIARELGFLHIEDEDLRDAFDMGNIPEDRVVILSTGSQGEPLSALARIANGDHKTVKVREGDTVVISATPVPGNEKAVSRVINRLFKAGAEVYHRGVADVHVSGHAAGEELKMMLSLVKPRYFLPIHGETRHLRAHAHLAEDVGIPKDHIFVLENGTPLELSERSARRAKPVVSGVMYVDGMSVGDVSTGVLRDRRQLSKDGIITIVAAIDAHSGKVMSEPEVVVRGTVFTPDEKFLDAARARVAKVLTRTASEGATDHAVVNRALRDSFSQFIWERTRSRPMIIPIVMEV